MNHDFRFPKLLKEQLDASCQFCYQCFAADILLMHVPPKAGSHNPKGLNAFVTLLLRIQSGIKIILLKLLCHTEYEQKQDSVICSSKLSLCLGPKINSLFTVVFYVCNKNIKY